ncbi:hypothetical protein ACU18_03330 [Arthrobacter sp. ZBG10]|nr:hypothetical protein ACU18_03330 [Arthrobacter sp. ZBG10]
MKQDRGYSGEILYVRSLGTLQPQDFVVQESVSTFQFAVEGMQTLQFEGLRSQLCQEPVYLVVVF